MDPWSGYYYLTKGILQVRKGFISKEVVRELKRSGVMEEFPEIEELLVRCKEDEIRYFVPDDIRKEIVLKLDEIRDSIHKEYLLSEGKRKFGEETYLRNQEVINLVGDLVVDIEHAETKYVDGKEVVELSAILEEYGDIEYLMRSMVSIEGEYDPEKSAYRIRGDVEYTFMVDDIGEALEYVDVPIPPEIEPVWKIYYGEKCGRYRTLDDKVVEVCVWRIPKELEDSEKIAMAIKDNLELENECKLVEHPDEYVLRCWGDYIYRPPISWVLEELNLSDYAMDAVAKGYSEYIEETLKERGIDAECGSEITDYYVHQGGARIYLHIPCEIKADVEYGDEDRLISIIRSLVNPYGEV